MLLRAALAGLLAAWAASNPLVGQEIEEPMRVALTNDDGMAEVAEWSGAYPTVIARATACMGHDSAIRPVTHTSTSSAGPRSLRRAERPFTP